MLKKRENAHIDIYVHKKGSNKRKNKQNFFSYYSPNVLERKLDFDAHEKNKETGEYL